MSFQVGDALKITATFEDLSRNPVDPTAATFVFRKPGATTETSWTWPGGGGEILQEGTGKLYVVLDLDAYGEDWDFRWTGVGANLKRVIRGKIRVAKPTLVTPP